MSSSSVDTRAANAIPFEDLITPDTRFKYGIPVNLFIDHFRVTHPDVRAALVNHPSLCYMLGRVETSSNEATDRLQPDKIVRPIFHLVDGSGMFGLENADDALRWPGIFGHSLGTARQAWYVFNRFKQLTPDQRRAFEKAGYDFSEFDSLDPSDVRDFMMVDHLSRRAWDEKTKDNINLANLPEGSPGETARYILERYKAPTVFLDLIRIEDHAHQLVQRAGQAEEGHYFPNIVDAILTYVDWTFERSPIDLTTRFERLRQSRKDIDPEVLKVLESCGRNFQVMTDLVLETDIISELQKIGPYEWEYRIRKAYCTPSGINVAQAFAEYIQQYPELTAISSSSETV
ncbi:hypothetical protein HYW87_03690 [Candidatus Roizmanbacteria bacterium]|nr:hypothetical protein [Candidatus Roizmanbacteria bacterium]